MTIKYFGHFKQKLAKKVYSNKQLHKLKGGDKYLNFKVKYSTVHMLIKYVFP